MNAGELRALISEYASDENVPFHVITDEQKVWLDFISGVSYELLLASADALVARNVAKFQAALVQNNGSLYNHVMVDQKFGLISDAHEESLLADWYRERVLNMLGTLRVKFADADQ